MGTRCFAGLCVSLVRIWKKNLIPNHLFISDKIRRIDINFKCRAQFVFHPTWRKCLNIFQLKAFATPFRVGQKFTYKSFIPVGLEAKRIRQGVGFCCRSLVTKISDLFAAYVELELTPTESWRTRWKKKKKIEIKNEGWPDKCLMIITGCVFRCCTPGLFFLRIIFKFFNYSLSRRSQLARYTANKNWMCLLLVKQIY